MAAQELTTQGLSFYGATDQTQDLYAKAQKNLADKDTFIQLLMAQMQNQDPLNPMENQEFVSQLAQISSVEQLQTVNSNLQMLSLYQSSINNAQAVSLIGKNIKASGDSVAYDGDGSTELSYKLDKPAAKVTITISDAKGNVVRTLELTNVSQGEQSATWDGTNMDGSPMEEGDYAYKVTAVDTSGGTVGATTYISGLVQSITFENGAPVLMVGSHKVSMGDILEVEIPR